MASTYTTTLRLEKPGIGEADNAWGTKLNTDFNLIDDSISGVAAIVTTGGTTVLTTNNAATDEARMAVIKVTGALVSNATLTIPDKTKIYKVWNATTGAYTVTVKASGTGVVVPQDAKCTVFCDASASYFIGDITGHVNSTGGTSTLGSFTLAQLSAAVSDANVAPLSSPAFVDTPTAPTAAAGTNNTQIATTAFAANLSMAAGNMPVGGVAGQALRKTSSTNYETEWASITPPVVALATR